MKVFPAPKYKQMNSVAIHSQQKECSGDTNLTEYTHYDELS